MRVNPHVKIDHCCVSVLVSVFCLCNVVVFCLFVYCFFLADLFTCYIKALSLHDLGTLSDR